MFSEPEVRATCTCRFRLAESCRPAPRLVDARRSRGVLGLVGLLASCGGANDSGPRADPARVVAKARSFERYRLYFSGRSFGSLPLTDVSGQETRTGPVTFIYGACKAKSEEGCAPPVEIQTWSICRRHYRTISRSRRGPVVRVRGVPAAQYREDGRLEIYTGHATVVLFTRSIG